MQMDEEARALMGRLVSALLPATLKALKADTEVVESPGEVKVESAAKDAAGLLLVAQAALRITTPT